MAIDIQAEQPFIFRKDAIKRIIADGIIEKEEVNGLGNIYELRVANLLREVSTHWLLILDPFDFSYNPA